MFLPFHATDIDADPHVDIERSGVNSPVAHRFVRGIGESLRLCTRRAPLFSLIVLYITHQAALRRLPPPGALD